MSIVSGTVGAILGADAQKDATEQNAKNVKDTNAQNYRMFQEARGSTGSAVLPLYLRTKSGNLFESQLGQDLVDSYDAMHQDPQSAMANYRAVAGAVNPARLGALKAVNGIFNGENEKAQLANFAPVKQARVAFKRQSAVDALNKTLGEISAAQAAKGYTGDSMGTRLLAFNAQKGAADAVAQANLENLAEERAIHDAALQAQVANAGLPYSLAANEINFANLPQDAYIDQLIKQQQPLKFLYIGAGNAFQNQNLPTVTANPSTAQLLAQGNAALGNTALNYWLNSQLASQYAAAGTGSAAATRAGYSGGGATASGLADSSLANI